MNNNIGEIKTSKQPINRMTFETTADMLPDILAHCNTAKIKIIQVVLPQDGRSGHYTGEMIVIAEEERFDKGRLEQK